MYTDKVIFDKIAEMFLAMFYIVGSIRLNE